jgi:hypothetical protein
MFDLVMVTLCGLSIIGVLYYALKPVMDTVAKDEKKRKLATPNS